jgi:esterase/lipase superfamily enzyme
MKITTSRERWLRIGQEALSAADRLLKPKEAAKFKLKLGKLLAAVEKKQVSPLTIKTLLDELSPTRNWLKRKLARAAHKTRPRKKLARNGQVTRPQKKSARKAQKKRRLKKSLPLLTGEPAFIKSPVREGYPSFEDVSYIDLTGATKEAFCRVRVFFGTDRKKTGETAPGEFFGAERGELSLGSVEVSIPHDHRMGELEGPSIWKLQFSEDPSKHVVLLSVDVLTQQDFIQSFSGSFQSSGLKQALLFVHGYNVRFEDACRRTAQIAYDLKFEGVPVAYSWPSEGKVAPYPVDETNVQWSVPDFEKFLTLILSETGAEVVHVIAHSMGNRALVEALHDFDVTKLPAGAAHLSEVIFAAPDIDAATFLGMAKEFGRKATRFTLYASSKDRALKVSKRFHKYPRAGDSGKDLVLLGSVDTIDATEVDTGLLGHSYIEDNASILTDVFQLLKGNPPKDRARLRPLERSGQPYWVFEP